jgi:hypothetical protein
MKDIASRGNPRFCSVCISGVHAGQGNVSRNTSSVVEEIVFNVIENIEGEKLQFPLCSFAFPMTASFVQPSEM